MFDIRHCQLKTSFVLVGLGLALLSQSGCTTPKQREEATYHMRIGTSLIQQNHYPEALAELLKAEKLDPSNARIENNLGLVYFMREKYELAAQHLKRTVELEPGYSEGRNNYGRVLIELGQFDQAIKELNVVVADLTYPDPAKAWVNVGLAYFRQGAFKKAKESFAKAIQLNRENCLGQTMYGRSLFELNDYATAAPALDNAVVICRVEKLDEAPYFSGLSYYKLGNTEAAISRMEEVLKTYPGSRYAKKAESLLKLMR